MKAYIFTNMPGKGDQIAAVFERRNASVVVKEMPGDQKPIYAAIREVIDRDEPNSVIIALLKDHVGAAIYLNKASDINAAVCASENDTGLAIRNKANVYLFGQGYDIAPLVERIAEQSRGAFVSGILKRRGKDEGEQEYAEEAAQRNEDAQAARAKKQQSIVPAQKQRAREYVEQEEEEQNEEEEGHVGREDSGRKRGKGFMGFIKESLGFGDGG